MRRLHQKQNNQSDFNACLRNQSNCKKMKDKEYHTCDFKLNLCCTLIQFRNHMYDFSPNCIPLSSITTMNWTPLSPIKTLQIRLYLLWSLVAIFSPSQNKREKNKETNQLTKIKKRAKTWPNQNKKNNQNKSHDTICKML